jgi:hypothetical protein
MKTKFGLRSDGTEKELKKLLTKATKKGKEFNFVEVGTCGGASLKAFQEILQKTRKDKEWRLVGIDTIEGVNKEINEINKNFPRDLILTNLFTLTGETKVSITPNIANYVIIEGEKFLKNHWKYPIHFCHIDALHCSCHVTADFLAVEPHVVSGGIVLFHDFCLESQGTDHQHDGHFIEVREACQELGLIDGTRPGWKFIGEINGSRKTGGEGNGFGIFQRE